MTVIPWALGGLAVLALMRPRAIVSDAAFARLGVVTDTEYLTLTPALEEPFMEIVLVDVIEPNPVPGTYAKVWVTIQQTRGIASSVFCRIIDDDTGAVVGYKKDFVTYGSGDSKVVKYDWVDDWSMAMPNRVWNLRIETGTNI